MKQSKPSLPLRSLGFGLCIGLPLPLLLNPLSSQPPTAIWSIFLIAIVLVPVALCLMLAAFWGVWGSGYDWNSAGETEREAFLVREQKQAVEKWKFRGWMLVFVLLCSGVVGSLAYGIHYLWKPLPISFGLFVCINLVLHLCVTLIALCWLELCDCKLRATRMPE